MCVYSGLHMPVCVHWSQCACVYSGLNMPVCVQLSLNVPRCVYSGLNVPGCVQWSQCAWVCTVIQPITLYAHTSSVVNPQRSCAAGLQ